MVAGVALSSSPGSSNFSAAPAKLLASFRLRPKLYRPCDILTTLPMTAGKTIIEQYAQTLAALEGDDFQDEVFARLSGNILGFQPVPAKPKGDGGVDFVSHNGTRGYCCYGPEHNAFKTNKALEKDIIRKFSNDLRRLFELELEKGQLVERLNANLPDILRRGVRIAEINLICNWFESHKLIGAIQTAAGECVAASNCRYVDPHVSVRILGPSELARIFAVDEITIARIEQYRFVEKVKRAAETVSIGQDAIDFDKKMERLRVIYPDRRRAVDEAAEAYRTNWRMALAFDHELDTTLPHLHRQLEADRREIVTRVVALLLGPAAPHAQLGPAGAAAEHVIQRDFGGLYPLLVPSIANGEVARLIGECTLGWEAKTSTDV